MTNRYIVRCDPSKESQTNDYEFLEHAQDAYIRRLNYDKQKRHEKYLRDRDAGKTGYKGSQARTSNPYGNYASLYYNPEKAAAYYRSHRGRLVKSRGSNKNESKQQQIQNQQMIGDSGAGASGGSGGASGSGGSGSGAADNAAAKKAINDKIKKLREDSQFETAAQRKATQIKIEELRNNLQKKLDSLNKQREEASEKGQKERETLSEKASKKIEKEQKLREKNVKKDTEKLKNKKEAKLGPIREDNAALRGRLDSMSKTSDPKLRAQLLRKIAKNNESINKANADYTDSLSKVKTQHSLTMRKNIGTIRADLQNARLASSAEQRSKINDVRNRIQKLRNDNKVAIKSAQEALKNWTSNEKTRVAKETARLKGEQYKDPTAENKAYENRVNKRANEILGRSGSTKTSSIQNSRSSRLNTSSKSSRSGKVTTATSSRRSKK